MKRFVVAGAIVWFAACGFHSRGTGQWKLLTTQRGAEGLQPISAITAISFTGRNHGWAVTPSAILETNNGGRLWTERIVGEGRVFHSIAFINPTTGWVVGSQFKDGVLKPLVLNTVDGGRVWREQSVEASAGLQTVSFCDANIGWAAGSKVI